MGQIVNNYYRFLGQLEVDVTLYLETCLDIVIHEPIDNIDSEIIFEVMAIKKINEKLDRNDRIAFLCNSIEDAMFTSVMKKDSLSIVRKSDDKPAPVHSNPLNSASPIIQKSVVNKPKTLLEQIAEEPFNYNYK